MGNKTHLAALALLGISSTGLLAANETVAAGSCCKGSNCTSEQVVASANTAPSSSSMTAEQQAFADKLNASAKEKFKALSADGRAMAMKVANSTCKGKNECKGMGGCKTDAHSCAGKNECKGQGNCKVSDANKATDMASTQMAAKRANAAE